MIIIKICNEIFKQHENAVNYKSSIGEKGLFEQTEQNMRFFSGDQWYGAEVGSDRPLARYNIIRRIGQYKLSFIGAAPVSVSFSAEGVPNTVSTSDTLRKRFESVSRDTDMPQPDEVTLVMAALSDYYRTTCERTGLDMLCTRALQNAYISGSGIIYTYWDSSIKTGLYANAGRTADIRGDIAAQVLDIRNVDFGDPGECDLQRQPYIIIAQRCSVAKLRAQAKRYGATDEQLMQIRPDGQEGFTQPDEQRKATMLTRFIKRGETIYAVQVCRACVIRPEWDMGMRLYPLAKFDWDDSGEIAYGQSEITGIIPNQIAINRLLTAQIWSMMSMGMPLMLVNGDIVRQPVTNSPGQIISCFGSSDEIDSAVQYVTPPDITQNFNAAINTLVTNTLAQSGANEAALGDMNPNNAAAIIALREAANLPLQLLAKRYYAFIEQLARIFAECWVQLYGNRAIKITDESGVWYLPFNGKRYQELVISSKVEVGASSVWSEAQSITSLDNLYSKGAITAAEYIERLPSGIIPDTKGLVREIRAREALENDG